MYWIGATIAQVAVEQYRRLRGIEGEWTLPQRAEKKPPLVSWRRRIQTNILFLSISIGLGFYAFYKQVVSGGVVVAHRPAGVESFLPLSALLGLKRWLLTGNWDMIHPAGLTFLIAVIVSAILFRRSFCSWICPFGAISRLLEWTRHRLLTLPARWNVPLWLKVISPSIKYLILAQIFWVFLSMPLDSVESFLFLPYNMAADANMLLLLTHLSIKGFLVITGLVIFSVVIRNGWCRFMCPYGALLALVSLLSPLRVMRNGETCRSCYSCSQACGMGIRVQEKKVVHSPECTMCLSCVSACPEKDALGVSTLRGVRVSAWLVPIGTIGVLLMAYLVALNTGYWNSSLTTADYQNVYRVGVRQR